jgi:hypothetical protein
MHSPRTSSPHASPERGETRAPLRYDARDLWGPNTELLQMIRKLKSGQYRLYSRKKNPKTGKRRNLGTFDSLDAAKKHERAVQFFKRGGK